MLIYVFFFNDTATTEIYTLSLHDALPISWSIRSCSHWGITMDLSIIWTVMPLRCTICSSRSEEHTSELQSHVNLVCRLLLEKKKKKKIIDRKKKTKKKEKKKDVIKKKN